MGIKETREAIKNTPKGIFNGHVLMCACVFALSGVSKGFDEGELRLVACIGSHLICLYDREHCIGCHTIPIQDEVRTRHRNGG